MQDPIAADILLTLKQISIDLNQLRQENAELRQMLADKIPTTQGWQRTAQAAEALKPDGVQSQKHLRDLIAAGAFAESRGEIRNVSNGEGRSTWELYIPKAKSALARYFRQKQQAHTQREGQ